MNTQNKAEKAPGKISRSRIWLTTKETVLFAMFGAVIFCSKILMEALPNIHLVGMFVITFTVVYRVKGLIPIYIYVMLDGLFHGFNIWWFPYLYIWTILWAVTMLLPKKMPKKIGCFVYPVICGLHGFLFGTLYAPAYALFFGLDFQGMLAWIVAGLSFDAIHGVGNLFAGMLVVPLVLLLNKLNKGIRIT